MKIRIAGFEPVSVVDGPGIRFVIFTQGCPHNCKGCHNPHTHDPNGGEEYKIEDIVEKVKTAKRITGVTISGGEPFMQAEATAELIKSIKKIVPDVIVYSGYTYEELLELAKRNAFIGEILNNTDILVDGPYLETEKDLSLAFRGSRNQRAIDVRKSLETGKLILAI